MFVVHGGDQNSLEFATVFSCILCPCAAQIWVLLCSLSLLLSCLNFLFTSFSSELQQSGYICVCVYIHTYIKTNQ